MIIAVDFDGILAGSGKEFPDIGNANYTMVSLVRDLIDAGHEVVLWTSRTGKALELALTWCEAYKLHFCAVNDNAPSNKAKYQAEYPQGTRKVNADIYLDDHDPTYLVECKKFGQLYAIYSMVKRVKEILLWEEEN